MRPFVWIAGAFLLLAGSQCLAAPSIYPHGSSLSDRLSSPWAQRAGLGPARPLGVDAPERPRRTAGIQYKAVVILLQFTDMPADTLNHTPAAFENLLFSQGTHPTGSFRDYYNEVSRGVFDVAGTVTKWYTAPAPYSDYTNGVGGFGSQPLNAQQMALDAMHLADPDIDFSQYDNDGPDGIPDSGDDDGRVDGLFIVHAGPGGEETGNGSDIWSHKWSLPGAPVPVDGVSAFAYTTEPERWQIATPWNTPGELISIGVFCHEFGHVLGLPDLYDKSSLPSASEGVGEWDLMATGLYNHLIDDPVGSKPAHLSAWMKAVLGWVDPIWISADTAGVTIPPVETSGTVYRLWTNGVEGPEFFLLENRQPIGFDAALIRSVMEGDTVTTHGLMLYHVDQNVGANNDPAHKGLDIVEGGGVESAQGFTGVQNLDLGRGAVVPQTVCEGAVNVTGNRGDRYDPWPGLAARTDFDATSCPNSSSYCGSASQVAIRNIAEIGSNVIADLFVGGISVRRLQVVVDDDPAEGTLNNGNGFVEPGETARVHFPLQNLAASPTGELTAKVRLTEPFAGLLADSIYYGMIGAAQADTGTAIYADISQSPDPRGLNFQYTVTGPAGVVLTDSIQILIGERLGICENFESTLRRWIGVSTACGGLNEWHREAGINHTPGGSWAWRLGPNSLIDHYASSMDTRLVSQPIRLLGPNDTLRFWQRYDCEYVFDGLTVEISANNTVSWEPLVPVGGYNTSDRYSGTQATFTEAVVPLTGYSGLVQIAFRFRSQPPNEGLGWWIDDVVVTGNASCATTAVHVERFLATPQNGDGLPAIRLEWTVSRNTDVIAGIDRALGDGARRRIATLPARGDGAYVDSDVISGATYRYWLVATREGEPSAEAGPVLVTAGAPAAPRVLALAPVRPNPFVSSATLAVSLDRDGPFVVRVFRADGALVRTLARGPGSPADLRLNWDGRDERGRPAGAGIYFFELRSGGRTRVQKAVLLR